jgi:hypothetical protein
VGERSEISNLLREDLERVGRCEMFSSSRLPYRSNQ